MATSSRLPRSSWPAPLPDRVVKTNPQTVQHFAGLTGPVMIQLALQYLPRIIEEVRQMRARRG